MRRSVAGWPLTRSALRRPHRALGLVGLDPDAADAALEELPRPGERTSPTAEIYGGGKAGERAAAAIAERLG